MIPAPELIERFRGDLDPLGRGRTRASASRCPAGPTASPCCLLAAAARPGLVEAATVDHALRAGSRE